MRRLAASIVIALAGFGTAHSEISIKEYKSVKEEHFTKVYINGIGRGLFWANAEADDSFKKKLYCSPSKLALGVENYLQIIDDEIERATYTSDMPVELVLLKGL